MNYSSLFLIVFLITIKMVVESSIPNEFKMILLRSKALPNIGCNTSIIKANNIPFKIVYFHFVFFCDNGYKIPNGKNINMLPIVSPLILFIKSKVKLKSPLNQFIEFPELI